MSDISHIVKSYEEELQNLNDNLIKMGSLVETQLSDSMEAIIKVDKDAAENIIKNDAKINELRATIEEQIVNVLVKRAPMAIDLRLTISTLKISSDLERIGDLAKSVAKKIKPLPHDLPEELIASLRRLGDLVQRQLKDILDAYLKKSKELAIKIWTTDEKVDDLTDFWQVKPSYTKKFEAFIPIQNGCDKMCSFCAVPYTRGKEVSRSSSDILDEVRSVSYTHLTLPTNREV